MREDSRTNKSPPSRPGKLKNLLSIPVPGNSIATTATCDKSPQPRHSFTKLSTIRTTFRDVIAPSKLLAHRAFEFSFTDCAAQLLTFLRILPDPPSRTVNAYYYVREIREGDRSRDGSLGREWWRHSAQDWRGADGWKESDWISCCESRDQGDASWFGRRGSYALSQAYLKQLQSNPLRTKMLTSGTLSALQEVLASWLAHDKSKHGHYFSSRVPKMAAYGALISAPLGHMLISILQWLFAGRTSLRAKILQILVSNLVVSYRPTSPATISEKICARSRQFRTRSIWSRWLSLLVLGLGTRSEQL